MQTTTHYGFNIVEGTDIVNPLTQLNPNFTTLDTDLYDVSLDSIGSATEIVSGGVHSITRADSDKVMFRFIATGDFMAGDSMTVDGSAVTLKTVSGNLVPAGAYVTGSVVIGVLNSGTVTLMVDDKYIPTASEVTTTSGDSVQDELDNLGSVVTMFTREAYNPGDTWVISQEAQDIIDSGKAYMVEADFYFGATYDGNKLTRVVTRGFSGQVGLVLDRTDPAVGIVRINASNFESYGFSLDHRPILRNLYIFPLGTN